MERASVLAHALDRPMLLWWKRVGIWLLLTYLLVHSLAWLLDVLGVLPVILPYLSYVYLIPVITWLFAAQAVHDAWRELLTGAPLDSCPALRFRLMMFHGWPIAVMVLAVNAMYVFWFATDEGYPLSVRFAIAGSGIIAGITIVIVPAVWLCALMAASGTRRYSWLWFYTLIAAGVVYLLQSLIWPQSLHNTFDLPGRTVDSSFYLFESWAWLGSTLILLGVLLAVMLGRPLVQKWAVGSYATLLFIAAMVPPALMIWGERALWLEPLAWAIHGYGDLPPIAAHLTQLPMKSAWEHPWILYAFAVLNPLMEVLTFLLLLWLIHWWIQSLDSYAERRREGTEQQTPEVRGQ